MLATFQMSIIEVALDRRAIRMTENSHESTIGKLAMGEGWPT